MWILFRDGTFYIMVILNGVLFLVLLPTFWHLLYKTYVSPLIRRVRKNFTKCWFDKKELIKIESAKLDLNARESTKKDLDGL